MVKNGPNGEKQGGYGVIKTFGLLDKRSDISQKKFHSHWRGPHAVHALTLVPVMRRYVQNHKAAKAYPGFNPPCDGAPEVWLQDLDAAGTLGTMPEYLNGAYIDEPNFMDKRSRGVLVREEIIREGDPIGQKDKLVKALFFVKRAPGLSAEHFREIWSAREEPLFVGMERARRFVKSATLPETYVNGDANYDGTEEIWWNSEADFKRDHRGSRSRLAAAGAIADKDATTAMFVDENRVFWPGLDSDE